MTDITTVALIIGTILILYIKSKPTAEQLTKVSHWLEIACYAAEEAARKGLIDKSAKYKYAVELLERRGITFDDATTQALIDSTVYDLFNRFKEDAEDGTADM